MLNNQIDSETKLYNEIFENTLLCNKRKIFKKTRRACRFTIWSSKLNLFNTDNDLGIRFLMAILITKIALFNL